MDVTFVLFIHFNPDLLKVFLVLLFDFQVAFEVRLFAFAVDQSILLTLIDTLLQDYENLHWYLVLQIKTPNRHKKLQHKYEISYLDITRFQKLLPHQLVI